MEKRTLFDFNFNDIEGKEVHLKDFKDYVILIVNTASQCGFTPQLEGLEKLYQKYKQQKFIIIGFPCNQFQNQEPGSNSTIKEFCTKNYGVSFLLGEKIEVNGSNTHPLYNFLKSKAPGILGSKKIKWNFTKFLIDRKGVVYKRFSPYAKPSQISSYIEKLI
jgi:glutathione peroxidase